MKLIDTNVHVIIDNVVGFSCFELTAQFEDVINDFPVTMVLKDVVKINSTEIPAVFEEEQRLVKEHPFFRLRLCETPIELRFFVFAMDKIPGLRPQVVVDSYRIDLAIPNKKVAIELDGHEFHKSREHRTYDAKRERYLQRQGWQVIRFTGTEIHKDVFECIGEAIEIIKKMPSVE
jgi:very-short-patch-repair endonuclease